MVLSIKTSLGRLAAVLLFLAAWVAGARAAEPIPIFVLHAYSQEYPWTLGQHRGFMEALKADAGRAYDVRVEYLDTKRTGYAPAYAAMIADHLREKYRDWRPAAVYVTDDNALSFALTQLEGVFPGVPVFFSGVNNYAVKPQLDPGRVTGVFEKKEIAPNLELMRSISKGGQDILIVGDATETYRATEGEIRKELDNQPDLRATFVSSNAAEELIGRLKAQKARFVFLTTLGGVADRDGRTLTLPEVLGAIVKAGDFIVFSMEDAYLLPGVVGGYVTSGPRQGRAAAGLLRRYLDGESIAVLAPIEASPNEYVFDDVELARAGLALPASVARQASHVNVQPTFYETNRALVLGTLYALVALLVLGLAVALRVFVRKNRQIVRTTRQLADSERLLSAIVDNEPECVHLLDQQGRLLRMNRAGLDMLEATTESQVLGREVTGIVMPDHRVAFRELGRKVFEGGTGTLEFEIQGLRGRHCWLETHAVPLRNEKGEVIHLLGLARDITERKAMEQELRESEERLQLFIEHAPASLAMFDRQMRYLAVSRRWMDDYSLGEQNIIGRSHYEVFPEIPERWKAVHRRGMEGEVVRADEDRFERADGTLQWLRWEVRPWYAGDGTVGGIVIFTEDISGYKRAADEIRLLNADLERRVSERTADLEAARNEAQRLAQAKSEFLANMSHEIRTRLSAVLGLTRIGARDSAGSASEKTFDRIQLAGEHLLGVINDILDFSKLEAGRLGVEVRPFHLGAVIANTRSFVVEAGGHKGLAYTVEEAPDLPEWVKGDARRLQQILTNLLSNAVKFTERGEVRLQVTREGDTTSFRVSDTGIGMTTEQLARLFKPFEQADSSTTRRYGGTGLGLVISRNLANLMAGEISVESAVAEGSAFTLKLPLPATEPDLPKHAREASQTQRRLDRVRLLAAEDVEVNRLILEDLLAHEGAQVVFAENGREALERLEEAGVTAFDAVLMDVQMPVMDGYEATRRIREIAPGLPVIGLTAHALAEERYRCLAAGMVEHVTKPVDADELVAAVLRHVASSDAGTSRHPGR